MLNIDVIQAKDCFPALVEQAAAGQEIIITQSGRPVVRLVHIQKPQKKRKFGSAKGLIKMSEDFDEPLEDFRDYM